MRGYDGQGLFNNHLSIDNDLLLGSEKSEFRAQSAATVGTEYGPYANMMFDSSKRVPTVAEMRSVSIATCILIRIS